MPTWSCSVDIVIYKLLQADNGLKTSHIWMLGEHFAIGRISLKRSIISCQKRPLYIICCAKISFDHKFHIHVLLYFSKFNCCKRIINNEILL